jgi:hypothetical protein
MSHQFGVRSAQKEKKKERTTTMTQEVFPEIRTAIEALESRVAITEAEIAQMNEDLKAKKAQVKSWRKALSAFSPRQASAKKNPTAIKGAAA